MMNLVEYIQFEVSFKHQMEIRSSSWPHMSAAQGIRLKIKHVESSTVDGY